MRTPCEGQRLDPLLLRMTAVLLLFNGPLGWYPNTLVKVVVCAMLVSPRVLRSAFAWSTLAAFMTCGTIAEWHSADNHQYLSAYWVIAIAIALSYPVTVRSIPDAAKTMVALTFAFACFWKVVSGEFLNGMFWEATLLTDGRLSLFARAVGDVSRDALAQNASLARSLSNPASDMALGQLISNERVVRLAHVLTWSGLALEATVAVLFITPRGRLDPRFRVAALVVFLAIYVLVPVVGFAWILIILTIADVGREDPASRVVLQYVALAALLFNLTGRAALNAIAIL